MRTTPAHFIDIMPTLVEVAQAAGIDAIFVDDAVGRRDKSHRMCRTRIKRLADHDPGLGPIVRVIKAIDPGDNRPGTREHHVGVVELIRLPRDVGA